MATEKNKMQDGGGDQEGEQALRETSEGDFDPALIYFWQNTIDQCHVRREAGDADQGRPAAGHHL